MQARPTPYPAVNALIDELLSGMRSALDENLLGVYLYGSLVTGDFDPAISDIDFAAVTSAALSEGEASALREMHAAFERKHPDWDNRIEVAYVSVDALQTYRSHPSDIAVISPGESFHLKQAGIDWLANWYLVREMGVTVYGPPPATFVEPIAKEEYVQAIREYAREWRERIQGFHTRPSQAYTILTLCRALYTVRTGGVPSKRQAAEWAQGQMPEWSSLLRDAVQWRENYRDEGIDDEATLEETRRFVYAALEAIGD